MPLPDVGFVGSRSSGFTTMFAILFGLLVMVARKQLGDYFDIEVNLPFAFAGAALTIPITFFFGVKWGFLAGAVGLTAGIIAGNIFGGGGE